jgi:hypothetical protein
VLRQRGEVATQDEGPADGVLLGGDVALGAELETRIWRGRGRSDSSVLLRHWVVAARGRRSEAGSSSGSAGRNGWSGGRRFGRIFGLGAPDKVPPAVDDPRAAVQRTGDSADEAAAAKGSAHGALSEQQASEASEAAAESSGKTRQASRLRRRLGQRRRRRRMTWYAVF